MDRLGHGALGRVVLLEEHLGCLPVVEGDALVGIVTEADLLRVLVECPDAR